MYYVNAGLGLETGEHLALDGALSTAAAEPEVRRVLETISS